MFCTLHVNAAVGSCGDLGIVFGVLHDGALISVGDQRRGILRDGGERHSREKRAL